MFICPRDERFADRIHIARHVKRQPLGCAHPRNPLLFDAASPRFSIGVPSRPGENHPRQGRPLPCQLGLDGLRRPACLGRHLLGIKTRLRPNATIPNRLVSVANIAARIHAPQPIRFNVARGIASQCKYRLSPFLAARQEPSHPLPQAAFHHSTTALARLADRTRHLPPQEFTFPRVTAMILQHQIAPARKRSAVACLDETLAQIPRVPGPRKPPPTACRVEAAIRIAAQVVCPVAV